MAEFPSPLCGLVWSLVVVARKVLRWHIWQGCAAISYGTSLLEVELAV